MLKALKPSNYYFELTRTITSAGYNAIESDTDHRQREIWNYIKTNNLTANVISNYDFKFKLAIETDPHYQISQSRAKDIDLQHVDDLYTSICEHNKPMLRIPIGTEIDGKLYIASGNHRARVRKKHQLNGNPPDGHVLVIGSELSDLEKKLHLHEIAVISNRHDDHQTDPETEEDITHQLRQAWRLHCELKPKTKAMDEEGRIEWGKDWVRGNKIQYKYERMSKRLGAIVNNGFQIGRGQSLSMPDDVTIAQNWKEYWATDNFEPGENNGIFMKKTASHAENFLSVLDRRWEGTIEDIPTEEVWVTVRAGTTLEQVVTSMKTVRAHRNSFVKKMIHWNSNNKRRKCKFPLVTKVYFPEQIPGEGAFAIEWNRQSKNFDALKLEFLSNGRKVVDKQPLE